MKKPPVFILGCARSGTSMTSGIIDICGGWGGNLHITPTPNNRKGMYENFKISNSTTKLILRRMGFDQKAQKPIPNHTDKTAIIEHAHKIRLKDTVMEILNKQGYQEYNTWYYKDPKMCFVWPAWKDAFPDARWIIIRRDSEDIVRSCQRTSFMNAYKNRSGWLKWVAEHERCFEEIVDAKVIVGEIWPQRMINGDFKQMQMIVNNLGLNWKEEDVMSFVEPKLWARGISRHGKSR